MGRQKSLGLGPPMDVDLWVDDVLGNPHSQLDKTLHKELDSDFWDVLDSSLYSSMGNSLISVRLLLEAELGLSMSGGLVW